MSTTAQLKEKPSSESIHGRFVKLSGKRTLALRKLPTADSSITSANEEARWTTAPDEAYDLLKRCLDLNPLTRITASDALHHVFLIDIAIYYNLSIL